MQKLLDYRYSLDPSEVKKAIAFYLRHVHGAPNIDAIVEYTNGQADIDVVAAHVWFRCVLEDNSTSETRTVVLRESAND